MLDSPQQRAGKRKRMGPPPKASLAQGGDSEQALRALETYANQAEEALGEALDEVALKDRRIAALEAELAAQLRPGAARAAAPRPAVVLPSLSPTLSRSAQQTRQALEAIGRHTGEAEQALAELLAAADEKEQGFEELQTQLNETRNELQQQQQRSAAAVQEAASGKDRRIAELDSQQRRLEEALTESRRQLAAREARLEALEQELGDLRASGTDQAHQLEQLREVLEHYVLRCRDLEHRAAREPSPSENGGAPSRTPLPNWASDANGSLSPLAQRLKSRMQQRNEPASLHQGDGAASEGSDAATQVHAAGSPSAEASEPALPLPPPPSLT